MKPIHEQTNSKKPPDVTVLEQTWAAVSGCPKSLQNLDRYSTAGLLAASLALELGSPLNAIQSHADMIQSGDSSGDQVLDSARVISEQAARITRSLQRFLHFTRHQRPSPSCDLALLLPEVIGLLTPLFRSHGVTHVCSFEPGSARADVDEADLRQTLVDLFTAAVLSTSDCQRLIATLTTADEHVLTLCVEGGDGAGSYEPLHDLVVQRDGTSLNLMMAAYLSRKNGATLQLHRRDGFSAVLTLPKDER